MQARLSLAPLLPIRRTQFGVLSAAQVVSSMVLSLSTRNKGCTEWWLLLSRGVPGCVSRAPFVAVAESALRGRDHLQRRHERWCTNCPWIV